MSVVKGIVFDPKKIAIVPIEQVTPNTYNPKSKNTPEFEKIKEGIKLKGQRMPIVVRELKGSEENPGLVYEILDGEQRYTAAKDLGFTEVLIYNEGPVSDKEARELTIWYQQQVPFNEIDLAGLVTNMLADYDNIELPFTDKEIAHFKDLAEFNFDNYNTEPPENTNDDNIKTIHVVVNDGQFKVIREALDYIISEDGCSEGQALERIAASFLAEGRIVE